MIDKSTKQHYEMQGKVKNYLGKQKMVKAPKYWKSGPDHPDTELAYITKAEKDLILKADLHGSLSKGPNRGPSGIISLNSAGSGYGGPGPGSGGGGGGGGGGGRDRWDRSPAPAPAPTPTKSPQASRAREEKAKEDKARDEERAFEEKDRPGYVSPEELKTRQIKDLIAKQQEEKYGPTADPDILGERLSEQELPKGHPDRIKEETERAVKQLSTKEGTEEALREFKALKTGRGYTPDINLLEKLGIKKPEGILGSLVDTGKKFFDPKKMVTNYALKKMGLGAAVPWLGLLSFIPQLFGKTGYKDMFAKKPAFDMEAASKLGLQTDRFPTQPTDTLTAERVGEGYRREPISTTIAKGEGLESGAELLGLSDVSPEFQHLVKQAKVMPKQTHQIKHDLPYLESGAYTVEDMWNNAKTWDDTGSKGFWGMGKKEAEPMTKEEFNQELKDQGYTGKGLEVKDGGRIDRPLTGRRRDI